MDYSFNNNNKLYVLGLVVRRCLLSAKWSCCIALCAEIELIFSYINMKCEKSN